MIFDTQPGAPREGTPQDKLWYEAQQVRDEAARLAQLEEQFDVNANDSHLSSNDDEEMDATDEQLDIQFMHSDVEDQAKKLVESEEEVADEPDGDVMKTAPVIVRQVENPRECFRLVQTLQRTLYGKVVLAVDVETGRQVAIKLSNSKLMGSHVTCSGQRVLENPEGETLVLQHLMAAQARDRGAGCDRVINMVAQARDNRYTWTVLEFAEQGELFSHVEANGIGGVGIERAQFYFRQIAEGLSFLHRHSIVHLDLSLENVLLNAEGNVKICDFGVARVVAPDFHFNTHENDEYTGTRPGKIAYMAPEVFASAPYNGMAADVYTLGVDLFILLTGVSPYSSPTPSDQRFHLIINGHLDRLLEAWKLTHLVPQEAVELLTRMLAPEARRCTIADVLAHPWVRNARRCRSAFVQQQAFALPLLALPSRPANVSVSSDTSTQPATPDQGGSLSSSAPSDSPAFGSQASPVQQMAQLSVQVPHNFATPTLAPASPSEEDSQESPVPMTVTQWLRA